MIVTIIVPTLLVTHKALRVRKVHMYMVLKAIDMRHECVLCLSSVRVSNR